MDYFLKAANEAELRAALVESGVVILHDATVNAENEVIIPAHDGVADGFCLDIIGTISKPTGVMLSMGPDDHFEYPEMVPVPGYHANLRGELSDTQLLILAPILLETAPANPFRVWA